MDENNSTRAVKAEAQRTQAMAGRSYIITAQTVKAEPAKAEPVKVEAALPYAKPGQLVAEQTQQPARPPQPAAGPEQPAGMGQAAGPPQPAAGPEQPAGMVQPAGPPQPVAGSEQLAGMGQAEQTAAEQATQLQPTAEQTAEPAGAAAQPAQQPSEAGAAQPQGENTVATAKDSNAPKVGTQLPIGMYTKQDKKKRRKNKGVTDMLINSPDAPFQYQEAFHFLRTNINFLSANRECKKIVVTSSIPNEGKTTVAINLALSLSAANNSVVLVDADLRKPSIHNYLSVSPDMTMGLTDVLRDRIDVRACVHKKVDRKSLYFIPSGMIPPNPTELMGSEQMGELLAALGEFFDYVILDTPPVAVVTDAAVLAQYTDGAVLVIRQKMASYEQAKIAKKNLESVGGRILGVVLNNFDRKHLDKNSGYYYSYYYGEKRYE